MKLDEIIRIYVIIFLTFVGMSTIVALIMLYQGKTDTTGAAVIGLVGAGIATGVIKAFSDAFKYISKVVCQHGCAPECEPYKFALDKGWRPKNDTS